MNRHDKNRIAVACICQGCTTLYRREKTPATVEQLLQRVTDRATACTSVLPEPTEAETRAIRNRIGQLRQLFADQQTTALVLSSFLLAIVEDAQSGASPEISRAFTRLHSAVRQLHQYHDRQLSHHGQYRQAARMADRWQLSA